MKNFALLFLCLGILGCAADGPKSVAAETSFSGHYELTADEGKAFSLDVAQSGTKAEISFSASNENGSGAAPDGGGEGTINSKGELAFKFSDSFENRGTAVLRRSGPLYQLSMEMNKVEDSRAVVHYGDLTLKRTPAKPPTENR